MPNHWTKTNQAAAHKEGWGLYKQDDGTFRIERCDESDALESDNDAVAFVTARAIAGDERCAKALQIASNTISGENASRIHSAITATTAWMNTGGRERGNMIRDLIADLCHLADFIGRDPADEIYSATEAYEAEVAAASDMHSACGTSFDDLSAGEFADLIALCVQPGQLWRPYFVIRDSDDKKHYLLRDTNEKPATETKCETRMHVIQRILDNYEFDNALIRDNLPPKSARAVIAALATQKREPPSSGGLRPLFQGVGHG